MKARTAGILAAVANIAFVAFIVASSAASAQGAEAVGVAIKSTDKLLDLGALGIFCVILILGNGAQFWASFLERRDHKAELKERNDLLATWAAQTSKAVADATAATTSASATTATATAALVRLTEQMARSDAATARAVDRLERLENSAGHPAGGRQ